MYVSQVCKIFLLSLPPSVGTCDKLKRRGGDDNFGKCQGGKIQNSNSKGFSTNFKVKKKESPAA